MPTITSNASGGGNWATGSTWAGGVAPADGETVVIAAGDTVVMDADLSGWTTGVAGLTITSSATTPGMLQFKSSGDGTYYLKMANSTNIVGTNAAVFGRLMMGGGTWGSPAAPGVGRKQVLEFLGTTAGKITGQYLAGQLICNEPTNAFVEVYKTAYGPRDQATYVTPADDYIDWGTAPPIAGTAVRVKSSVTLPTGLSADAIYYVRAISSNKCKLALQNDDVTIVDITATGSGNITMYDGHTDTATKTVNVIQDVTGDALWTTTAGFNRVVLADIGPVDADVQLDTLATINAGTLIITTANVDSAQYPCARLYLASRNVQIITNSTSATQPTIDLNNFTASANNNWSIACAVIAAAATTATKYCYGTNLGTSVPGTAVVTISGGTISGYSYAVNAGTSHTISGGTFIGCTYAVSAGTSHTISGGTFSGCGHGVAAGTSHTISGGTFSGCTYAVNGGTSLAISGGTIIGCTTGINAGTSHTVSGGTFSGCANVVSTGTSHTISGGTFSGCTTGVASGVSHTISGGTFSGCTYAINLTTCTISGGATFTNNTYFIRRPRHIEGAGVAVTGGTVAYEYLHATESITSTDCGATIYDYTGTAGYVGRWDAGGYTVSAAWSAGTHDADAQLEALYGSASPPTCVHVGICQDSDANHLLEIPIWAAKGQNVTVHIYARCLNATDFDTAGDSRPTFSLAYSGTPTTAIESNQLADNDDWQHFELNSAARTAEQPMVLRCVAKGGNAGGTGTDTFYWFQIVELDYPPEADVESGMSYGNGEYEGELVAGGGGVTRRLARMIGV